MTSNSKGFARMRNRYASAGCIALPLLVSAALLNRAFAAVSCSLSGPTLTFGTINIFANSTTSGNATLTCSGAGAGGATIYACLSIGTGSGGTTASNRTLASGSNKLPIQVTGGASWPPQIGNGTSYPMEGVVSFPVSGGPGGSGSYAFAIVVTIPQPSPLPPAGTYSSSFTGADFQVRWNTAAQTTCPNLVSAGGTKTSSSTMSVSATVVNQCSVSATNLNFGSASLLTSALSATAQVSVTCNAGIPLTVALDNGGAGTSPTNRLMTAGSRAIQYGIYKDGSHSQPWGNTAGVDTASANGPSANLTAFGRVPTQSAPTPGSYADVVGVMVTY